MPRFRATMRKMLQLDDTPESIAGGVAIGWVIGMTPPVWPQSLVALLAALALRRNRISAMMSTWFTNPVTYPIYLVNYMVGGLVFRLFGAPAPLNVSELTDKIREAVAREPGEWNLYRLFGVLGDSVKLLGEEVLWPMFIGGLVVGFALAPMVYWAALNGVRRYRARRTVSVS